MISERHSDGNEGQDRVTAGASLPVPEGAIGVYDLANGPEYEQELDHEPGPEVDALGLWDEEDDVDDAVRRTLSIPLSSIVILGVVFVVVSLTFATWAVSRRGSDAPLTNLASGSPAAPVTSTAPGATPTGPGAPTTATPAPAAAGAPSTATRAPAVPTTAAAPKPVASPATPPSIAAFCSSADAYSLTSLVILGQRAVADPDAVYTAYEGMVKNAPSELAPAVEQLRPMTTQVHDEIANGKIKTPEALRTWLSAQEHWPAEAEWLKASLQILPVVKERCPA